jgi:hypothetical protein
MVKAQVVSGGGRAWSTAPRKVAAPPAAPTEEQAAAIEAFGDGHNMVLEALAGTGKTTTLRQLAHSTNMRGLYLAYNRSTADEAQGMFPSSTRCSTIHSLAYRAVVDDVMRERLNAPRQTSADVAKIIGAPAGFKLDGGRGRLLGSSQLARLALETVTAFCYSDDQEIGPQHVPAQTGVDAPAEVRALAAVVVPLAKSAWWDLRSPDGAVRFQHDHYMKLYALREPQLAADFVLVDEAQDSNDVVVGLVNRQRDCQVVAVGDRRQQLYEWRGSVDAMDAFHPETRLYLTQSFRFGPAIAERANRWLIALGADVLLRGTRSIQSVVGPMAKPAAVLCRTNAEVIQRVMDAQLAGTPVAIAGGGRDVRALAEAAEQLKDVGRTWHPELCMFTSWGEVQDYVEEGGGQDLKTLVRLVDRHGARAIVRAIDRCVPEATARLVVSTVHKAKGREWGTVLIADDFEGPGEEADGSAKSLVAAEAMTAYVAVTRARFGLDDSSLSWLDAHLDAE